jgi:tRNA A-37 threonylcarbamoyl transferase component Bud32
LIKENNIKNPNELESKYIFYIEMEMVEDGILLKHIIKNINNCNTFIKFINYLDNCLKKYNIYHNDLNPGNIFLSINKDRKITKITIIDWGQSSNTLNSISKNFGKITYKCKKNKLKIKKRKFKSTKFNNTEFNNTK